MSDEKKKPEQLDDLLSGLRDEYVSTGDPVVETADTPRMGKEVQVGSRVPGWVFRGIIALASGIFLVVIGLMLVQTGTVEKVAGGGGETAVVGVTPLPSPTPEILDTPPTPTPELIATPTEVPLPAVSEEVLPEEEQPPVPPTPTFPPAPPLTTE